MCKARIILIVLLHLVLSCCAQNVRRKRGGDNLKGVKDSNSHIMDAATSSRKLKGKFFGRDDKGKDDYYQDDYYIDDYDNYNAKGKKGKKHNDKGRKKGKKHYDDDDYYYENHDDGYYQYKKGKKYGKKGKKGKKKFASPSCRTVVEPAEFYMHNALQQVTTGGGGGANSTRSGSMGSRYIFQGPLLDEDLEELEDYYVSGVCTKTWSATKDAPGVLGAAFCSLTFTIATGANINVAGEVFDAWENNVGVTGGTFEMTGVRGQATLVAVDDELEEEGGDFFLSEYIWGRVTLVYKICPEGYWDPLIVDDLEDLEGKTYPDPFDMQ